MEVLTRNGWILVGSTFMVLTLAARRPRRRCHNRQVSAQNQVADGFGPHTERCANAGASYSKGTHELASLGATGRLNTSGCKCFSQVHLRSRQRTVSKRLAVQLAMWKVDFLHLLIVMPTCILAFRRHLWPSVCDPTLL